MKHVAAPKVILDKNVLAPLAPNTLSLPAPPNAAEAPPLLPGCNKITIIKKTATKTCNMITNVNIFYP